MSRLFGANSLNCKERFFTMTKKLCCQNVYTNEQGRKSVKNGQKTWQVNHLIYAAGSDLHNTIRTRIAMMEPINADALRQAANSAGTR